MKPVFRWIWTPLFVVILITGSYLVYVMTTPASKGTDVVEVVIERGEGVNEISRSLDVVGLVKNQFVFETIIWARRAEGKIFAGTYRIPKDVTMLELVDRLIGSVTEQTDQEITLIEGWTAREMDAYLADVGLFEPGEFLRMAEVKDTNSILPGQEYAFLSDKPKSATLEGYLFPDTYRVFPDTKPEEVIEKMLENFDTKVTEEMRASVQSQDRTLFDVVTLASIIEREVQSYEDKRNVADVFLKRLRDGIPLQSDATVNYVTGKNTTRPSTTDLQVDSPYNTYQFKGLPPGPISNPGLDSIRAAIYPEENPYYFFLTTKDNDVIFSKTLEEHNQNKARYLGQPS
ncbi:MAG: endolytic transglycosylase MltG [Candidatus Kerfeldbacteria bacterium]|nr:endolytic transglycosylase MltG [Candidatus Kerfeldbacteria bacterium]